MNKKNTSTVYTMKKKMQENKRRVRTTSKKSKEYLFKLTTFKMAV